MNNFYADKRYYIDFSKIVFLEFGSSSITRVISISFINGKTYAFYEDEDRDYGAFNALKTWHELKIKGVE